MTSLLRTDGFNVRMATLRSGIADASAHYAPGASERFVGRAFRHDKNPPPEGLSFDFSEAFLRGCPILRALCEGWAEETSKVTVRRLALKPPVLIPTTQAPA